MRRGKGESMRKCGTSSLRETRTACRRTSPLVRKWLRVYGIDAAHVSTNRESNRLSKSDVQQFMAEEGEAILRSSSI